MERVVRFAHLPRQRHFAVGIAVAGLVLTMLLWAVLVVVALLFDAHWPQATVDRRTGEPIAAWENWHNLITIAVIVEFSLTTVWALVRRQPWDRRHLDWVTVALAGTFLCFAIVFLYAMGSILLPVLQTPSVIERTAIRAPLNIVLFLATIVLLRIPDDEAVVVPLPPSQLDTRAVIIANDVGTIVWVSPLAEALLGWDANSLRDQDLIALIPPRYLVSHLDGFARWRQTGVGALLGLTVRVPACRQDGTEGAICLHLAPLPVDDARWVLGTIGPSETCPEVAFDLTIGDQPPTPTRLYDRRSGVSDRRGTKGG